tara:strand:+ start:586 stop:1350 length:765 start_codon:yes stop_codon:yes gene_type:complete
MHELDPALSSFLSRYLGVDNDDSEPLDGYFRLTRGKNVSQSRSVGIARIEIDGEPAEIAAKILEAIDKLTQEEYRLPHAERQAIYLQVVDRGVSPTRHCDWCCVFDPGETASAMDIGAGSDMAARTLQAVIVELMRQNRDMHTRTIGMLDYSSEIILSAGNSDMSAAIEAIQPTLTAIGNNLPAILAARARAQAPTVAAEDLTPQERTDRLLDSIELAAQEVAAILMRKEAQLDETQNAKLAQLRAIIDQVLKD